MDLAWLRWTVPSWLRWMAPWWGRWMAPWWGRWRFQQRCRCPGDTRFSTVWGNVWRVVGTEYVRRIMVGIFRGKSRLAEVSPDSNNCKKPGHIDLTCFKEGGGLAGR